MSPLRHYGPLIGPCGRVRGPVVVPAPNQAGHLLETSLADEFHHQHWQRLFAVAADAEIGSHVCYQCFSEDGEAYPSQANRGIGQPANRVDCLCQIGNKRTAAGPKRVVHISKRDPHKVRPIAVQSGGQRDVGIVSEAKINYFDMNALSTSLASHVFQTDGSDRRLHPIVVD